MNRNKRRIMLLCIIAAIVLILAVVIGYVAGQWMQPTVTRKGESAWSADDDLNIITYHGIDYKKKSTLQTVLFLGVDDTEAVDANGSVGNNGRADAVMLVVCDDETQSAQILQISRDTIVSVDVYDTQGKFVFSGDMQINMQYAFGDSGRRSCWLMKQKVSDLLYGLPVDCSLSLTMEGISSVINELGGLIITMPEDYTEIDTTYRKGATVTLDGEAAERFVRYRDTAVSGSNDTRMERQACFLKALFRQVHENGNTQDMFTALQKAAEPYMQSDLDLETMTKLSSYTLSDEILKVPGETQEGELHDEYYVDEEALKELLVNTFYEPVS